MRKTKRRCVWCNQFADSEEHIYSRWMRDMLPEANFTMRMRMEDGSVKTWNAPVVDQAARFVCSRCNNTWGSDLEVAMKDATASVLLRSERRTFTPAECKAIADFGFKTTVLANHIRMSTETPFFLDSDRRSFASYRTIPSGVQVWIARRGSPYMTGMFRSVYGFSNNKPQFQIELYTCTFSFGFLILQTLTARWRHRQMRHLTSPPMIKQPQEMDDCAVRIWPNEGSVDWPPKVTVGDDTIEQFWDRFNRISFPTELL